MRDVALFCLGILVGCILQSWYKRCRRPASIRIAFEGVVMPVSLLVGQSVIATATEADTTGANVPIANPGSLSWTTSDPTIATSTTNTDGTATFAAVAAGSASVTVTDASNGLTTSDTITVTAVAPVATSIAITFGTPQ